ncbi:MAG: GNAT family N-acetyltransferase [SAR202 cluster bacterium]|nr:GNAT family N-acetyltransferase [SAR202 cluster bacterium]
MAAPISLHTNRLVLRPHRLTDIDDAFAYASDPEFSRYLALPRPYTRRHAEQFLAICVLTDWSVHPQWAIEYEGHAIGGINIRLERGNNIAGLGYGIGSSHWGKGIATEAARAVVDWGFTELGVEKIHARCGVENAGSWRVMEKIGMKREGLLRKHYVYHGERRDDYLYGILREEWQPAQAPSSVR